VISQVPAGGYFRQAGTRVLARARGGKRWWRSA